MSTHNLTIECPICEDEIEVEVSVGSWGYPASFDDPGSGPEDIEWETPTSCTSCKGGFDQDQHQELHNKIEKKIDDSLGDWEHDMAQSAADYEVDRYLEDLHYKNTQYGDGPL